MFTYKSLASGALELEMIFIANNKPMDLCYRYYWRDANNYQQKKTGFYNIIHVSMQFSAMVNRFILKTKLSSTFTNDLKRK